MRARGLPVWALALVALLVVLAVPAAAQEGEPEPEPEHEILSTGQGTVEYQGRETAVPMAMGFRGPLFLLSPLVGWLGGELVPGPLGLSQTLRLGDDEIVIGADSAVMTLGQEIVPLSQRPLRSLEGIHVPLDFLERTYGDLLGYQFEWQLAERRLLVDRASSETLPVQVDWVHSQGITTLLLIFPRRPRYRVDTAENPVRLDVLGDRLHGGALPSRIDDPLVREVVIGENAVSIVLAAGAVAAEPYGLDRGSRFELVFDVSRPARAAAPSPVLSLGEEPRGHGVLKIVLDPGHGGGEQGALGKRGSEEKTLTLLLARRLKTELERRLPVRVVLTRNEDADLPLETRTAIANQNQADLFLSLHLNSEPWGSGARGAETYFLSMEASDARAASSAEFENRSAAELAAADSRGATPDEGEDEDDFGLQLLLWALAQSHHLRESQRLANLIQQELNETLELPDRGVKQAPFRVLMGATMPAVLVELGFVSNPEEEERLQDPAYRQRLVSSLVEAIVRFRAPLREQEVSGVTGEIQTP